jgi:iterative type I PKS product template protein
LARRITISPPTIPIISNVHGVVVLPGDASVFDPHYYSRHCTEPVLFGDGLRAILDIHTLPVIDVWIEIGPNATILPLLRRNPAIQDGVLFLTSMRRQQHPLASLYSALSQLYVSPFEIRWRDVFSHLGPLSNTSLPGYPWSNASFWVSFEEETPPAYRIPSMLGPKAGSFDLPYTVLYTWIQTPSPRNGLMSVYETPMVHLATLIRGHCVRGQPLCPASVYQELALAGVEASNLFLHSSLKDDIVVLRDVEFPSPLVYNEDAAHYAVQTSTTFETENVGSWKVASTSHGEKKTHARGGFQLLPTSGIISNFSLIHPVVSSRVAFISKRDGKLFTTSSIYEVFFPRIVAYGKCYRAVQTLKISADGTEGYATIQLPNGMADNNFVVHPILMDAILHVAGFIANMLGSSDHAFICSKIGCVEVIPPLINVKNPYGVYVNYAWLEGGDMLAESYALEQGSTNRIVARLEGIRFRKVPLVTLELALAATGPILPEFSTLQGSIASSGSSLPLPSSHHVSHVHSVTMKSSSGALSGSPTPGGIEADILGTTTEVRHAGGHEACLSSGAPVRQLRNRDYNPSQSDVRALLATVLGLEEKELHEDADLESLGLDSLASIEAHHALQSHFALLLPSDLFAIHTTAKAVQSFITGLLPASFKSLYVDTDSRSIDTTCLAVNRSGSTTHFSTILNPIQRIGLPGRTPLILVHDGSGLIKYTHNLSSLGRDLWGIHNPRFIDSQPWESVVSMATEYAKYTTQATGPGPILLGGWNAVSSLRCSANVSYFVGWSFGGTMAFEVARQLLKSGIIVKGVVLIDSPSPLNHVPLSDALIEAIVKLDRSPVPSDIGRLVKRQFQMNSQILLEYDPTLGGGPYPPVVLLRSCANYCPGASLEVPDWLSNRDNSRSTEWETIVGGPVKCIEIPGHHFQPFHSPYVRLSPVFHCDMLRPW